MPNYSNGKIYTIRFYDNDKLIYIGSTTQILAVRFGGHKININCSLFQYIQENYNGDFKCCYIELLEPNPCNNKNELDKKEGEYIRQYKTDNNYIVINKNIAGRTRKQYNQDNADKFKQYEKDNADKIKERKKQYYQDNEDNIKEYQKQYRKDNADKINQYRKDNADNFKEYQKQYEKDNADKIKERKKQYRKDNADKIKEKQKQYRKDNADKFKEYQIQYYQKKKAEAEAAAKTETN
jgi:hypothetical protein